MVQWIHYYEANDQMLDTVLATFVSVFPYATVWEPARGDIILVGAATPWMVDLNALEARLGKATVQQSLRPIGLTTPAVLLALEAISQENTRFVPTPSAPLHTDVDPVLEYAAERDFSSGASRNGGRQLTSGSHHAARLCWPVTSRIICSQRLTSKRFAHGIPLSVYLNRPCSVRCCTAGSTTGPMIHSHSS